MSKEISRNGGYDRYRAALADEKACRTELAVRNVVNWQIIRRLRQAVAGKLRLNWSPEQIAGWLKRTHAEDGSCHVSHETIYRSFFVQARGVLKKELMGHLRSNGRSVIEAGGSQWRQTGANQGSRLNPSAAGSG